MTENVCARCPKPAPHATICGTCRLTLETALHRLPGLIAELQTTAARQNVQGTNDGRGSAEQPLPIHVGAMEAHRHIKATLTSWALLTHEEQPATLPTDTSPTGLAQWLADRTGWLARHPAALDIMEEIAGAADRALTVIENQTHPVYWGPCACGADLYSLHEATTICCAGCNTVYDAGQRRAYLVTAAEDRLATTTEIEHLTAQLGQRVPAPTIRQWQARGHVLAHGTNATGIPLYRVGDVLDRLKTRITRSHQHGIPAELSRSNTPPSGSVTHHIQFPGRQRQPETPSTRVA
jgi:hypothetical protein